MKSFFYAIPLVFLISCQKNKASLSTGPVTELIAESFISWNGDSLPAYPDGKPKISIVKVTIPPHSELPHHYHPVINAGVLLSGELTVVDEKGNVLKMKSGDPIVEVVNTVHYGKNEGDIPAEILVFYAGAEGMEIAVKNPGIK
jgi:quercetin dioxygenase-like cupin family protein